MQPMLTTRNAQASLLVRLLLIGTLLTAAGGASLAADNKSQDTANNATLKGLTAIRVAIDLSEVGAEQQALRKADLQARLEGRLKRAGLQILGESERAQGMPTLYLNFGLLALDRSADPPSTDVYVYSIDLALVQEVRLLRAPGIKAASPTWRAPGNLGTVEAAELASLRDAVDELADRFLAAYRTANGK